MLGLKIPTFTACMNLIGDAFEEGAYSHCNLLCSSTVDDSIMVCLDGSVFTAFEVIGTQRYLTSETEISHIDAVQDSTQHTLRPANHKIGMMFVRDPNRTKPQLEDIFKPTFDTINRLGLDAHHFFEEQIKDLEANCSFERALMIVFTKRTGFSGATKEPVKLSGNEITIDEIPLLLQDTSRESIDIIHEHQAYVKDLQSRFSQYLGLVPLNCETYLKYVKEEEELISLSKTKWSSKGVGSDIDLAISNNENDFVAHPPLAYQTITDDKALSSRNSSIIQSGDYHVATMDREYFNIQPYSTFQSLFKSIDRHIPFRVYYELNTGTDQICTELGVRQTFLLLFRVSEYGRNIDTAIKNLLFEARNNNRTLLSGTMSIATWATTEEQAKKNKRELKQALTSWGSPTIRTPSNLNRSYFSTLPGFAKKQSARACTQLDTKHLATLPITRPATPMTSGGICMSSQDGKMFPINPVSSEQDYAANVILGPMKSGKTAFCSILNTAIILAEGNEDLPPMSYLDFGSGVVNYIRALKSWLPKNQHHKLECVTLKDSAFNILEPQFGLSRLEPYESEFCVKFLKRLVTGDSTSPISGQLSNTLSRLLNMLFDHAEKNPRTYEPAIANYKGDEANYHRTINQMLRDGTIALESSEPKTWFTIRDKLFQIEDHKFFDHARFCHRQGSHDLTEFLAVIRENAELRKSIDALTVEGAGETSLGDYIIASIQGVLARFGNILGSKSQIDVSQAKIVGVDVKPLFQNINDAPMQKVFAILAKYLGTRNFWRDPETFMRYVPDIYREHYTRILDAERNIKKHDFMDEYAQFKSEEMDDLQDNVTIIARKYNLILTIAAQLLNHVPKGFMSLATNVYVLSASPNDVTELKSLFKLSDSLSHELSRRLKQSDGFGRLICYIGRFSNYEGYVVQLLRNQITASYLWNFASDEHDETLKMMARLKFGEKSAFIRLGKAYPNGTCLDEIARLTNDPTNQDNPLTTKDAINLILESLEYAA
ncbi:hypothetical protein [Vibrio coralliilyticus]|uniref:hypothetical protein n=1 Tax=Vibrio coralliilyticus TaxID=190893 RepID=UPI001E3594C5|nr:hypothetical protein [Vibrio coralliilyticus]MCC2524957.1 hypothetical protein [Vibrio coralliilyticus]